MRPFFEFKQNLFFFFFLRREEKRREEKKRSLTNLNIIFGWDIGKYRNKRVILSPMFSKKNRI